MTPSHFPEFAMLPAILTYFDSLPDPRINRTRLHPMTTLLGIALCAVLCGAG